jgi:hypothetical protein
VTSFGYFAILAATLACSVDHGEHGLNQSIRCHAEPHEGKSREDRFEADTIFISKNENCRPCSE